MMFDRGSIVPGDIGACPLLGCEISSRYGASRPKPEYGAACAATLNAGLFKLRKRVAVRLHRLSEIHSHADDRNEQQDSD